MILDDLFDAVTAFDAGKLAALVHPDARFSEMPNLINPEGTERDREAALAGLAKGRELLSAQSYKVHERVVDGDTIAARVTWRGALQSGQELTAHIATFTQVRDGKIYRHATYDCYEAMPRRVASAPRRGSAAS
jgi:ketosteroid isomerase-like protein